MDIFERIMFNRYFKANQAVRRAEAYRDAFGYENLKSVWFDVARMEIKQNRKLLSVPATYNPIRSDDLPLEEFLKQHPEHRNIEMINPEREKETE